MHSVTTGNIIASNQPPVKGFLWKVWENMQRPPLLKQLAFRRIATRRPISCQTPRLFLSTCPLKSGSLTISDGASPGYISSRSCLCSTFPLLRQHRTIASSSLSRLFAPLPQFRKWEIHTVFHHFRNFELGQKFWLSLLAELCGAALTLSECTSLSCLAIFQCGLGKGVGS